MHRFPFLRTALTPFSLMCVGILLAGCGGSDGGDGELDPTRSAKVRFMNLSQSARATDFYLDGHLISNDANYASPSYYRSVKSGSHRFGVTDGVDEADEAEDVDEADDSDVTYEEADSVPYDSFTVYCVDDNDTITPIIAKDPQQSPIVDDLSILRVVQASPTTGPVDIYVTSIDADLNTEEPDMQDVIFKTVTDYGSFPGGDYKIRITPANSKTVLLELSSASLRPNSLITLVLHGNQTNDFPLDYRLLEDKAVTF